MYWSIMDIVWFIYPVLKYNNYCLCLKLNLKIIIFSVDKFQNLKKFNKLAPCCYNDVC